MSAEILFIAHRIPFPPNRGDKVRSHHLLKRMAPLAPVHVACFADDEEDAAEEIELAAIARSYQLVRRNKPLVGAGVEALIQGLPVSLTAFDHPYLRKYIAKTLKERPISTIFVFSGQMGQYIPSDYSGRVVMDFVDVDSAKFGAYAMQHRHPWRWIEAREARLLSAEEARVAARADINLLATQAEAALFRAQLGEPDAATDIRAMANGIASDVFDRTLISAENKILETGAPRLIFTGQMDYPPNIDAAMRAAQAIMPLIRQELPEASLHIVGRNPGDELRALHGKNGIYVWGRVPDIRPWLKAADMALVPLNIARGIQNKVLEAMAMELPVVLSPGAATGIAATDQQHFAIADSDAQLAASVIRLAKQPKDMAAMGISARQLVVDKLSWQSALADLPGIMGITGHGG